MDYLVVYNRCREIFREDSELAKREIIYTKESEEDKIKENIRKLKDMGKI